MAREVIATLGHKIDSKGAIICNGCGRHLRVSVGFLTPERTAAVVLYERCKYGDCHLYNMIFLDRLEVVCSSP